MNYISHLHLATHTQSSLVGSFLGDFVKGRDLSSFSKEHQFGILLHRKIDSYTDQHDEIKAMKRLFPDEIRRYAGIVLDIYYDHLLMCSWPHYSSRNANSLFQEFYLELQQTKYDSNTRFTRVKANLVAHQWLDSYMDSDTCLKAMRSIESRFKHSANFAENAFSILKLNQTILHESFNRFYPDLMSESLNILDSLKESVAQQSVPSNE